MRRAVEIVKLQNRIQKLRDTEEDPDESDMGDASHSEGNGTGNGTRLQALGMFALSQKKQEKATLQVEEQLEQDAKRRSFDSPSRD